MGDGGAEHESLKFCEYASVVEGAVVGSLGGSVLYGTR